jgi:hypothetical protein
MRKASILLIFICMSQILSAQTKTGSYERSPTNINSIANISPVDAGAVGFDDRYEGVKGTPLLFDDWKTGNLFLKDNSWVRNLKLNLNVHDNILYLLTAENEEIFAIPNQEISEVHIISDAGTRIYRNYLPEQFDKKIKPDLLFEILAQGEYTFLKLSKKLFKEADYKAAYSADRRYDEYVSSTIYYLSHKEEPFVKIKPTRKNLQKLFPKKKNQIREIAERSGFSEGEELVMLVIKEL